MKETITVEKNGKFGPSVAGVWYSFGKFFKGEKELALNVPIDVDVFVATSGKKYINEVLGNGAAAKPAVKAPKAEAPKAVVPTDWAAKDRSQLVGGRSHDAAALVNASLVTGTPLADVVKLYREALELVLKMAEEVK